MRSQNHLKSLKILNFSFYLVFPFVIFPFFIFSNLSFFLCFLLFHVLVSSFLSFQFFSSLLFFRFSFFFLLFLFFLLSVVRADAKTGKNSREVLFVKTTMSFSENSIFGPRWTGGVRNSPFEGAPVFLFFISIFHVFLFFLLEKGFFVF